MVDDVPGGVLMFVRGDKHSTVAVGMPFGICFIGVWKTRPTFDVY